MIDWLGEYYDQSMNDVDDDDALMRLIFNVFLSFSWYHHTLVINFLLLLCVSVFIKVQGIIDTYMA